ncbi:MAG: molybdopterin-dependent oxidoreductase [Peptostreptococcales bacterium]
MKKLRLNINGKEVTGFSGQTILEVAKENDIFIPTLCYDERTEIYGSCGLCMVEVEGMPKLLKACATEISDNMIVKTDNEKIRESRKTNLELLLTQHIGDCRPPCVLACPAETDCQGYVGLIANGEYAESNKLIKDKIPLPASIGRVCPHPCETACRRQLVDEPIAIAYLKRFAADVDLETDNPFIPEMKPDTNKRVAVIGGGPSGLSAAYYLRMKGHDVTVMDAMPKMGGMFRYGIPEYRLPKEIVDQEISLISKMGAKLINNVKIGRDITLESLKEDYDAVYIAIGAWQSAPLSCTGEELEGVYGGIDFLKKIVVNEDVKLGERVAIVGGGNTAMDACRTAVRLGVKEVYNIYRRTRDEMPAEEIEIVEAEEEGVIFKYLSNPIEIIGENGKVSKIRLQKMELGEPDASGRRSPKAIEGEEEIIEVDNVIVAIGQQVDSSGFESLSRTKRKGIMGDESTFMTSEPGVFVGGDCFNDKISIAIESISHAKKAADAIDGYLAGEVVGYIEPFIVTRDDLTPEDFEERERRYRPANRHLSPEMRKDNFGEILECYTKEEAKKEASRCLECGCHDYFECKLIDFSNDYNVDFKRFAGEINKAECEDDHPFILRDPNKCILCGLCVRICDEVMGVTALGFVDRGFDTVVRPALGESLLDSGCVSCGQCISVCPTGALAEKPSFVKSVPVAEESVNTTCSMCSVGCSMDLKFIGNTAIRTLPDKEGVVNKGLLCGKGRFGYDMFNADGRLTKPMIKKEGQLVEVDWYEAFVYAAKKVQSTFARSGRDSVGVAISDRYTNEEAYVIKKFAETIGAKTFTFNAAQSGLKDVFGKDASPNTFEELLSTNLILTVGFSSMFSPVAGLRIREAAKKGVDVISVGMQGLPPVAEAKKMVMPENDVTFLKEIAKAILDSGKAKTDADGFEEFKASLDGIAVSKEASEIADAYMAAKKAMIVFNQSLLSLEGAKLVADIAVISGHIGGPRNGILEVKAKNNSQGLIDMGITAGAEAAKGLKALMIFGEDPAMELEGLEFLMVQDTHLTETAKKADIVFPATSYAETDGTFTNTERRLQKVTKAFNSTVAYSNWEMVAEMVKVFQKPMGYNTLEDVTTDMKANLPYYREAKLGEIMGDVLYRDGFASENKKAKLAVVNQGPLFTPKMMPTDNLMKMIAGLLPRPAQR